MIFSVQPSGFLMMQFSATETDIISVFDPCSTNGKIRQSFEVNSLLSIQRFIITAHLFLQCSVLHLIVTPVFHSFVIRATLIFDNLEQPAMEADTQNQIHDNQDGQ